jgi:predicted enzyme related to lactoylglutathione lyase
MPVKDTIFSYPVRNLPRMTDFYRDVLGFTVENVDPDGWTTLRSGHARIAIYPRRDAVPAVTHLMLVVDNLEETIAELNLGRTEVTDVYAELNLVKFKDPEGNVLTAIELPPGRA